MNKRGQVTVFIILGIILVFIVALIYFFRGNLFPLPAPAEKRVSELNSYIESCLKEKGEEALDLIGRQGGSIKPSLYLDYKNDKINYLCYTDSYNTCLNKVPFLTEHVESEISNYISENLKDCANLNVFREKGYDVIEENYKVDVAIGEKSLIINLDYPIALSKGDIVERGRRFSYTSDIALGKILYITEGIVDKEISNPLGVVFTNPIMALYKYKYEIIRETYRSNEIYKIRERGKDFEFQFAVQNYVK